MNFRVFCLSLLIAMPLAPAYAADPKTEDVAGISASIDKVSVAFYGNDAEAVADLTFDRLLDAVGGRSKYVESIKSGLLAMSSQGITVISHAMEPPVGPTKAGGYIVYVVKEVTILESRGKQFRTNGYTLAVRTAAGGQWKLIGGNGISQNPGILSMLLPGLPKDFQLPEYSTKPL